MSRGTVWPERSSHRRISSGEEVGVVMSRICERNDSEHGKWLNIEDQ